MKLSEIIHPGRLSLGLTLLAFCCLPAAGDAESMGLLEKQNAVRNLACQAGVPPDFALATIDNESRFQNEKRGRQGEIGASQILPATAIALGFDPYRLGRDFVYNAKAGVFILKTLLNQTKGNQRAALNCYRAGPRWPKLPPSQQASIRAYVATVEEFQKKYAGVRCR